MGFLSCEKVKSRCVTASPSVLTLGHAHFSSGMVPRVLLFPLLATTQIRQVLIQLFCCNISVSSLQSPVASQLIRTASLLHLSIPLAIIHFTCRSASLSPSSTGEISNHIPCLHAHLTPPCRTSLFSTRPASTTWMDPAAVRVGGLPIRQRQ